MSIQIRENLRHDYQGFLVRRGDDFIGYFWWVDRRSNPTHPHFAQFHIDLLDDEVYGFQYFIVSAERGGGVATDALRAIEAALARLGYNRVWGYVEAANMPARWLYTISGWSVAYTVKTVRLLRVEKQSVV
jgi:GNAT superfamily N-acetyltransferase